MQQARDTTEPGSSLQTCCLQTFDEGLFVLTDVIEINVLHRPPCLTFFLSFFLIKQGGKRMYTSDWLIVVLCFAVHPDARVNKCNLSLTLKHNSDRTANNTESNYSLNKERTLCSLKLCPLCLLYELNWWIFNHVPAPLTASLLAHDEQQMFGSTIPTLRSE